ncbi:MAG: hypothetical protein ACREPN_12715 [Rudaea sp.]
MRKWILTAALIALSGCQNLPVHNAAPAGDALARLDAAIAGAYDNHQQVQQAATATQAGTAVAVPHLREQWRALSRDHGGSLWLWRLQTVAAKDSADAVWLYLLSTASDGNGVVLTPYRAIDPAAATAALDGRKFKFVAEQWAELAPCAQRGEWKNTQFHATADVAACSALLPGLGESAALLPLRFTLDADMLHSVTFADQARGAGAGIDARRVRWFDGWAAINGGGPNAKSANQDWHVQKNLRLSSEGGREQLHWRDGAASGYSLELARTSYPERKLDVLQLNVIDDANGQVIDYVWANPAATAIGFNLGWLQVGLTQESTVRE